MEMEKTMERAELTQEQVNDARAFLEGYKNIPEERKTDGRALVSAFVSGMEAMKILTTVKQ